MGRPLAKLASLPDGLLCGLCGRSRSMRESTAVVGSRWKKTSLTRNPTCISSPLPSSLCRQPKVESPAAPGPSHRGWFHVGVWGWDTTKGWILIPQKNCLDPEAGCTKVIRSQALSMCCLLLGSQTWHTMDWNRLIIGSLFLTRRAVLGCWLSRNRLGQGLIIGCVMIDRGCIVSK
jgi:hypothetical protein